MFKSAQEIHETTQNIEFNTHEGFLWDQSGPNQNKTQLKHLAATLKKLHLIRIHDKNEIRKYAYNTHEFLSGLIRNSSLGLSSANHAEEYLVQALEKYYDLIDHFNDLANEIDGIQSGQKHGKKYRIYLSDMDHATTLNNHLRIVKQDLVQILQAKDFILGQLETMKQAIEDKLINPARETEKHILH